MVGPDKCGKSMFAMHFKYYIENFSEVRGYIVFERPFPVMFEICRQIFTEIGSEQYEASSFIIIDANVCNRKERFELCALANFFNGTAIQLFFEYDPLVIALRNQQELENGYTTVEKMNQSMKSADTPLVTFAWEKNLSVPKTYQDDFIWMFTKLLEFIMIACIIPNHTPVSAELVQFFINMNKSAYENYCLTYGPLVHPYLHPRFGRANCYLRRCLTPPCEILLLSYKFLDFFSNRSPVIVQQAIPAGPLPDRPLIPQGRPRNVQARGRPRQRQSHSRNEQRSDRSRSEVRAERPRSEPQADRARSGPPADRPRHALPNPVNENPRNGPIPPLPRNVPVLRPWERQTQRDSRNGASFERPPAGPIPELPRNTPLPHRPRSVHSTERPRNEENAARNGIQFEQPVNDRPYPYRNRPINPPMPAAIPELHEIIPNPRSESPLNLAHGAHSFDETVDGQRNDEPTPNASPINESVVEQLTNGSAQMEGDRNQPSDRPRNAPIIEYIRNGLICKNSRIGSRPDRPMDAAVVPSPSPMIQVFNMLSQIGASASAPPSASTTPAPSTSANLLNTPSTTNAKPKV